MLKLFFAHWCSHCQKAVEYLKINGISFLAVDIEKSSHDVVKLVIDANGGEDWVVPTIEFDGRWVRGKVFDENQIEADLKKIGAI